MACEETALRNFLSRCAKSTDEEFKTIHQEHSSKSQSTENILNRGKKRSTADSHKCDAAKSYDFPSNRTMCRCEKEIQHHDG